MSSSGNSTLSFSSDEEVYFKVYNIREELLLVTPYMANLHVFLEDYLDEKIPTLPHIPKGEMTFYKGHVYMEKVIL